MSMLMSRLKLTIYLMFSSFILVVTDIHTDGGRTNTAAHRDARTHLKTYFVKNYFLFSINLMYWKVACSPPKPQRMSPRRKYDLGTCKVTIWPVSKQNPGPDAVDRRARTKAAGPKGLEQKTLNQGAGPKSLDQGV